MTLAPDSISHGTGLLWKIEDQGGRPSHLFGAIPDQITIPNDTVYNHALILHDTRDLVNMYNDYGPDSPPVVSPGTCRVIACQSY